MPERKGFLRGEASGPRSARMDLIISGLAFIHYLEITSLERRRSLFRERWRFEVYGRESQLKAFKAGIEQEAGRFNETQEA